MRITIDVCAYYDWVEPPPGTEITEDDIACMRAKVAADDAYLIRVLERAETHHDVGIPETQIDVLAANFANKHGGEPADFRDEAVAHVLRESLRHHVHRDHLLAIHVHDEPEVESYLNLVFKTARNRTRHEKGKSR